MALQKYPPPKGPREPSNENASLGEDFGQTRSGLATLHLLLSCFCSCGCGGAGRDGGSSGGKLSPCPCPETIGLDSCYNLRDFAVSDRDETTLL